MKLGGPRIARMMQDRAVVIFAIGCATAVILGALGLLGWLTAMGFGSEALMGLVGGALFAYQAQIHGKVTAVQKVAEAALPTAAAPTDKPEGEAPRHS
jgi:hypothetical protein